MTDLFNLPETLSPSQPWMKRYEIKTRKLIHSDVWVATGQRHLDTETGTTEDEAITNLAKRLHIPLWNEEGFKNLTTTKKET